MLTLRSVIGSLPKAARQGFTVVELIVALAVGGVAFGAFALAVAQQERVHAELARRVRARGQLREGLSALAADLSGISPAAGDIAIGAAHDSSLELRTTIGTAVVCEVLTGAIRGALASFVASPKAGDTAWAYLAADSAAAWKPIPIVSAAILPGSGSANCAFSAAAASITGAGGARRSVYSLQPSEPVDGLAVGTPLRITRPARYSLYRSADERWYLGRREWSPARRWFETIQPVSGPYRPYAAEASQSSGLELRYFDADGAQVTSGSGATHRVAQLQLALRAAAPTERSTSPQRDVTSITISLRNRP